MGKPLTDDAAMSIAAFGTVVLKCSGNATATGHRLDLYILATMVALIAG